MRELLAALPIGVSAGVVAAVVLGSAWFIVRRRRA
jgi:hypothetical protein